jgi:hypothetical protein
LDVRSTLGADQGYQGDPLRLMVNDAIAGPRL